MKIALETTLKFDQFSSNFGVLPLGFVQIE